MTLEETMEYLDTLPLAQALWWFIENVNQDDSIRSEVFFHLRQRYRMEEQSPRRVAVLIGGGLLHGVWADVPNQGVVLIDEDNIEQGDPDPRDEDETLVDLMVFENQIF